MRISLAHLVLVLVTVQMLPYTAVRAQGTSDTRITLELRGETLASALKKIERATPFRFVYRNDEIRSIERITLTKGERTVKETLDLILENTRFTFREMKHNILIVQRPASGSESPTRRITGRVLDEKGEPLAGVSILVKGTTSGTTTDASGNFALGLSDGGGVLQFSFIGFTTQEIHVDNRTTLDVMLLPDVAALSEVVVTALGVSREERSLGYATQSVDGDRITFSSEQNVLGSLAGKIAGVQVVGSSAASMGGTQKIKIRGVNSITGTDQPLIVVDGTTISNANYAASSGVDFGNLAQDINPEDIASIDVLKGPAASALYGIRGQYGVIMITTKKGSKATRRTRVELNTSFLMERAGNFMPYQDLYGGGSSQTWRTLPNGQKYVDMSVDESWGPKMDGTPVRHVFSFYPQDPEYGKLMPFISHPDNIKDYFVTGININNGISISGGGANSHFRISVNDTRISGVEPNTFLNRDNLGISAGLDITPRLSVSTNINYAGNAAQRPAQGSEEGSRYLGQWFQRNVDMKRLRNYRYDDGTMLHWNLRRPNSSTGEIENFDPLYWSNPYFLAYENTTNDSRDRLFGDVGLTYELTPDLKLRGFIRSDMFTQHIESRQAFGGTGLPGYSTGKYQNREMNYEFLAEYKKSVGEFSISALLGGNIYDRDYTLLTMATVGGLTAPGYYNIAASVDRPAVTSSLLRKQIRSAYGMTSLGYRGIYFVDVSFRNDISSALPPSNNSYWYPSVSGSFVFSELLNSKTLTFGKWRLSYAQAGADLNPYETSTFFSPGVVYSGTVTANPLTVPDNLSNPGIKPSFAHSYETGVDMKFFNGRAGASITLYRQVNKNQILRLDVSGTSGYGSATINAGEIENSGIELTLSGRPFKTENLRWDFVFNIARNRNMVVELYPGITVYGYGRTTYSSVTSYMNSYQGKPFGSLVGQRYQRDSLTNKILLDDNNLPMFTSADHDFGTILPDYTGGLLNILRYGDLELSGMVDFQIGGQFFSRSKMLAVRTGLDPITVAVNDKGHNVRDPIADGGGVRVEGISGETGEPVTAYVDPQIYYGVVGRRIYEEWLYEATYFKLREVKLSYTFDQANFEKLPFQRLTIAAVARNPAMLYQKAPQGLDPSELSTGGQAMSWFESGQINTVRSYGINLHVTF